MDIDRYEPVISSADNKTFSFVSKWPKGDLVKMVRFIALQNIYNSFNLALGTVRGETIDYNETTDNGDRDKILATIFYIARIYSRTYPDQRIFIRGRNSVTTRLYRGAINHGYLEFVREFIIYGGIYTGKEGMYSFEEFISNKHYDAFLFERR